VKRETYLSILDGITMVVIAPFIIPGLVVAAFALTFREAFAEAAPPARCETGEHTVDDGCDCWRGKPYPCCRCGRMKWPDGERCGQPCEEDPDIESGSPDGREGDRA
jgi:hypothetical protein